MSANLPECSEDCLGSLPEIQFSDCAPEINNAQIRNIYIANIGNPLTDWTDPTEWNNRISESSTDADAIRKLTVVADKPKPNSTEKKISHDRIIKGKKEHVVNIEIDETNTVNYDMLRTLECNKKYLLWYEDEKYIYGGTDGIEASISLDHVIDKDSTAIELISGEAKWTSQFTPERIASPLV